LISPSAEASIFSENQIRAWQKPVASANRYPLFCGAFGPVSRKWALTGLMEDLGNLLIPVFTSPAKVSLTKGSNGNNTRKKSKIGVREG